MLFWWLKRRIGTDEPFPFKERRVLSKSPGNDKKHALLLGVGFDGEDGHTRITRGEEFYLVGGSEQTHEVMQEKAIKFNEELHKRGRRMHDLTRDEFFDIAERLDMGVCPKE